MVVAASVATLPAPSRPANPLGTDLAAALAAAGNAHPCRGGAPSDTRKVVGETMPTLPPELGGGPTAVLTQGLQWVNLAIQLPPEGSIAMTVHSTDADSAEAMAGVLGTAAKSLQRVLEQDLKTAGMSKVVGALTPKPSAEHPEELEPEAGQAGCE